jgi:alpha-ribazole phosphatase
VVKIFLIRHGATEGNLQRRYIGITDEALCPAGIKQIERLKPAVSAPDLIFSSPARRARESGEILFPGREQIIVPGLMETDFGIFENKTAEELSDCPEYARWLESMCRGPIPGGESAAEFKKRACRAFTLAADSIPDGQTAAFIVHGGVIMAVFEAFDSEKKDFYSYHMPNGSVAECEYYRNKIYIKKLYFCD